MSERKNLLAICGATVCGLILMTCTLLPATTNGASTEDLLPLTLCTAAGLTGSLGWIAFALARPTAAGLRGEESHSARRAMGWMKQFRTRTNLLKRQRFCGGESVR